MDLEDLGPELRRHCAAARILIVFEIRTARLYTIGPAYAQFMEKRKGMIRKGYLADIVIMKDDLPSIPPDLIMKQGRPYNRRRQNRLPARKKCFRAPSAIRIGEKRSPSAGLLIS